MRKEREMEYCPFWLSDDKRSITCEGIIGVRAQNIFFKMSDKDEHKKEYCMNKNCENCNYYKAVLRKYED